MIENKISDRLRKYDNSLSKKELDVLIKNPEEVEKVIE